MFIDLLFVYSSSVCRFMSVIALSVIIFETPANAITAAVSGDNIYVVDTDGRLEKLNIPGISIGIPTVESLVNVSQSSILKFIASFDSYYATLSDSEISLIGQNTSGVFYINPHAVSSAGILHVPLAAGFFAAFLMLL